MHESIKAALEKLPSLKRFCILCGDVRSFPLMRSLLLGALYNKSTTEVYIDMDSKHFDLSKYMCAISFQRSLCANICTVCYVYYA